MLQSLSHCELITDDGIRQLGSGPCAHDRLEVIELDNCPLITDASLEHLKNLSQPGPHRAVRLSTDHPRRHQALEGKPCFCLCSVREPQCIIVSNLVDVTKNKTF